LTRNLHRLAPRAVARTGRRLAVLAIGTAVLVTRPGLAQDTPVARTMSDVLAAASPADWRTPDPEDLLYLQLDRGLVVIELATPFVPEHAANIRRLVRQGYFDGLAIVRSQDNFVVQWGDTEGKRSLGGARRTLPPEFTARIGDDWPFTPLPDVDGYAPEVGFSLGFPAGRDRRTGEAWLAHCYGMVGAGRDTAVETGSGAELYVVIGHAPRQLDRNIALVGRVLQGMELLSTLPRGAGPLGLYEDPGQHVPIRRLRIAADVPAAERQPIEVLRTDTATFTDLVEARRNRRDEWYKRPAGHIDLCNVPIPVR
jgi:peptidylprolyl isomerase